jgi:hypothetical protein
MARRQAKCNQSDSPGADRDDPHNWLDRLLVEWARRGELPDYMQKAFVAPILEDYLFPATRRKRAQHRRDIIHQGRAELYSHEIKRTAAEQRIPISEATQRVCEKNGWHSVEALERYIRRGKRKADTKLEKMSVPRF